jgi:hypothetical protein
LSADRDPRDATLQALLRRHSDETPSQDLDAAIRAAAHHAVKQPQARPSAAWRVWIPLAAAASIAAILIGEAPRAPRVDSEPATVTDAPAKLAAERAREQSPPDFPVLRAPTATSTDDVESRIESLAKREQVPTIAGAKPDMAGQRAAPLSRALNRSARADSVARIDAMPDVAGGPALADAPSAAPAPSATADSARTTAKLRQESPAPATPAEWIARIRALRSAGNDIEAARELARFREAQKDADLMLPDDLRAWAAARR